MNKQNIYRVHLCAFALMAMMVLGQLYLLTHQIEHTLEGDEHACMVCELADHQSDSLLPLISVAPVALIFESVETYRHSFTNSHHAHYLSRAPPAHLSI